MLFTKATIFEKCAQQQTVAEWKHFSNHLIRVNQQAEKVVADTKEFDEASKSQISSLHNLAVKATAEALKGSLSDPLKQAFDLLVKQFNLVAANYITRDWYSSNNYQPMNQIEESLIWCGKFLKSGVKVDGT